VRALAHITGDGLLNLSRIAAKDVGFVLDDLPEPSPVFRLIAERADAGAAEMYTTFNMGVGFCVVVAKDEATKAFGLLVRAGAEPRVIGHAVADPTRAMRLPGVGLIGSGKAFLPA
jgi:phosphoribosylformylglycinamidine cyclo-ligase